MEGRLLGRLEVAQLSDLGDHGVPGGPVLRSGDIVARQLFGDESLRNVLRIR